MKKQILLIPVYCLLILVNSTLAGITGTLAGKVLDKKTQEPLPGANIILVDTYLGAAADEKGFFLVNNDH